MGKGNSEAQFFGNGEEVQFLGNGKRGERGDLQHTPRGSLKEF